MAARLAAFASFPSFALHPASAQPRANTCLVATRASPSTSPPAATAAVAAARQAAEASPSDGRLWMRLYKLEPDPEKRRQALKEGLSNGPDNPYLHHALGMLEWRSFGNLHAAVAAFTEGISLPSSAGSRGALYQSWGMILATEPSAKTKSLPRPPNLPQGADTVAAMSLSATDVFHAGLQDEPSHGPLYVALASTQRRAGLEDAATKTLRQGVQTPGADNHASLWRAYAVAEQKRGNFVSAMRKWERALLIEPNEPKTVMHFAELTRFYGQGEEAAAVALRKLVISTGSKPFGRDTVAYGELVVMLAELEERLKGTGTARAILEHEMEKFAVYVTSGRSRGLRKGSFSMVTRALAALEVREGNYSKARGLFQKAVDEHPSEAGKTLHQWAIWEQRVGDMAKALRLLQSAVTMDQADSAVWRALGELETRLGNFDKARMSFQRAVSLRSKDTRLWLAWGRSELVNRQYQRAEELFKTALSEDGSKDERGAKSARAARIILRARCEAACEAASLALLDGRKSESADLLKQAMQLDSSYASGWRQLAELMLQTGGPMAMRVVFKDALKRAPSSIHGKIYHSWGREERNLGELENARKFYNLATKKDPGYMSSWLSWGLLEKVAGKPDRACELFRAGAELALTDKIKAPYLFVSWARIVETELGNPGEAREIFEKGSQLCRKSPELLHGWALLEERQGCFERAIELYKRGEDFEPVYGSIFQSWGLLEARRRRFTEAARVFEKGTHKDPKNPFLWTSWGLVEGRRRQNVGRARELFERATTVDPNFAGGWHAWGALENEVENYDDARKFFTRAAVCDESNPVPHHSLGVLEGRRGDVPAARLHFKKTLAVDPMHSTSYQAWALMEERLGLGVAEARRLFEVGTAATSDSPSGGHIWQAWALFENRNGDARRAEGIFETGLVRSPNNQTLMQTYGIFLSIQGRFDSARKLFERATKICPRDAAPVYTAWAQMEASQRKFSRARELFNLGLMLNPAHLPGWKAWASMEENVNDHARARELRMTAKGLAVDSDADEENRLRIGPTILEVINEPAIDEELFMMDE